MFPLTQSSDKDLPFSSQPVYLLEGHWDYGENGQQWHSTVFLNESFNTNIETDPHFSQAPKHEKVIPKGEMI